MTTYAHKYSKSNLVYLFSSDVVLDKDNENIGNDLIRRLFGNFFYYDEKMINFENTPTVQFDSCAVETVTDLIDRSKITFRSPHTNMIERFAVNPSRVSIIDDRVDIPNLIIPFRLYASSDNVAILGDYHWKTLFLGGDFGGITLPRRINNQRIYYDFSFKFQMPTDYTEERIYEALSRNYPLRPGTAINIFSNYYDYNQYAEKYQNWTKNLTSELLIPNYNLIAEEYFMYRFFEGREALRLKFWDLDAVAEGFTATERAERYETVIAEEAVKETNYRQRNYSKNRQGTYRYHFPINIAEIDVIGTFDKDQYFSSQVINNQNSSQFSNFMLETQQNFIFPHQYFSSFLKGRISSAEEATEFTSVDDFRSRVDTDFLALSTPTTSPIELFKANGIDVNEKLSTFYNIQINFSRHKNEYVWPNQPESDFVPSGYDVYFPEQGIELTKKKSTYYVRDGATNTHSTPIIRKQYLRPRIEYAGYSQKFLEILKDVDDGTITDIKTQLSPFNFAKTSLMYNLQGESFYEVERPNASVGLKTIDFMDFLAYSYNNPSAALNENYTVFGTGPHSLVANKDDSIHRTYNTKSLITIIDMCKDLMKRHLKNLDPRNLSADETDGISDINSIIVEGLYGPAFRPYEVLAYKIEKIGGTPQGDSSEQNVLQKFWIYNSTVADPTISIIDSQIKYGENYTYKISAYAVVLGIKYKYDDFRLTKQVGAGNYFSDEDDNTLAYCLQFYNPLTNEISPQVFAEAGYTFAEGHPARTALSSLNSYAPSSVEISKYPQLADFNLYIEPCLKLVEVPMYEKTLKVMDHPCNSINVTPFHFIDETKQLGFQIGQESFIKRPYPELLTLQDIINKNDYMKSKELLNFNEITKFSESPARYIEVFRIRSKPESFFDFKDGLVATIDLRIKNEIYNYSDKIIADQIRSNTPYYYVFRFVSENGMPGPVSQIIKSEIVDDGGYTYALFDTIDSSEFKHTNSNTKDVSFKKIMQVEPNMNQLYFNESQINHDDYAVNQISNLVVGLAQQKIWDKKFKIRLTSKKTDKKLDINLSYKLLKRNLSRYTSGETVIEADSYDNLLKAPSHSDLKIPFASLSSTGAVGISLDEIDDSISFSAYDTELSVGYLDVDTPITYAGSDGDSDGTGDSETDDVTGASVSTPSIDAILTGPELDLSYLRTYSTTVLEIGKGLPASHYQLLTGTTIDFPDSPTTAGAVPYASSIMATIERLVSDPDKWDSATNDWTPEFMYGEGINLILKAIYSNRFGPPVTVHPLSANHFIGLALYAMAYIGSIAYEVNGGTFSGGLSDPRWMPPYEGPTTGVAAGQKFSYACLQAIKLLHAPYTVYGPDRSEFHLRTAVSATYDSDYTVSTIESVLGLPDGISTDSSLDILGSAFGGYSHESEFFINPATISD